MTNASYALLLLLQQQAPRASMLPFILQMVAIMAIFYFILIRPQAKQRKAHDALLRTLKKGDEVVTTGGLVGEVIHIRETVTDGTPQPSMDDRVTIKSGESRVVVERGRIAKVVKPTATTTA